MAYLSKDNEGLANRFFGTGQFTFANQFTSFEIEEESYALFGNVQFGASESLTFEVGGRLEYVENTITRGKTDLGNSNPLFFPAVILTLRGEGEGWYFSPSLGANYALNAETSVFARTSLTFKPQGFTGFSDNPATAEFDEEQSWETGVGVRFQNTDDTVGAELRGFHKQIDDYQFNRSNGITDFVIINADRVEAFGVEGELFWKPVDGLTVQASAGWNQIEFDDHSDAAGNSLNGNDAPFLPEFTAGLVVRYDFESGFFVQTGVRAVGATFYEETNDDTFKQGSYQGVGRVDRILGRKLECGCLCSQFLRRRLLRFPEQPDCGWGSRRPSSP